MVAMLTKNSSKGTLFAHYFGVHIAKATMVSPVDHHLSLQVWGTCLSWYLPSVGPSARGGLFLHFLPVGPSVEALYCPSISQTLSRCCRLSLRRYFVMLTRKSVKNTFHSPFRCSLASLCQGNMLSVGLHKSFVMYSCYQSVSRLARRYTVSVGPFVKALIFQEMLCGTHLPCEAASLCQLGECKTYGGLALR